MYTYAYLHPPVLVNIKKILITRNFNNKWIEMYNTQKPDILSLAFIKDSKPVS